MQNWGEWIYHFLGVSHSLQYKILATLIMALILYILRRLIAHFIVQNVKDIKTQYTWVKGLVYVSYLVFFIIISPIWITELQSMGTFLGLLSAGLAVALKEPISNIFAWIYIVLKQPFVMGDRVQIGDSEGDVLDVSFFEFTILEIKNWVDADQNTGRIIHVPNGCLFSQPIVNYSQTMNFIWNEIGFVITFESDWEKAKAILIDIEKEFLQSLVDTSKMDFSNTPVKFQYYYNNLEARVFTKIKPNGVGLMLRYLCHPKGRRESEQLVNEAILTRFRVEKDINFAYPTTRFYSSGSSESEME